MENMRKEFKNTENKEVKKTKGIVCCSGRETKKKNKRTTKDKSFFVWGPRKSEQERGIKEKSFLLKKKLRQRWLFLKKIKGIKTKGSKQGVEKTRKRHT